MLRNKYKKRRNLCLNLFKKAKKDHFANLDIHSVSENNKFWQFVKQNEANKTKAKTNISFAENHEMIDVEIEIAKLFNKYFVNIVKTLENQCVLYTGKKLSEVKIAIAKYRYHPSINIITEKMEKLGDLTFSFGITWLEETVGILLKKQIFP